MPASAVGDGPDGGAPPKLSLGQRILLTLPKFKTKEERQEKAPISDWARKAFLKPEDPDAAVSRAAQQPQSVEELTNLEKRANDKERTIGLVAAPLAVAIGFIVVHTLVINDPLQHLKNGTINPHYVNPGDYYNLFIVLLVLSVLMVVFSLMRRRLFLGIALALYGLGIFNLHYWGFGIPFVFAGAWYLVRAYRIQRDLRVANGEPPSRYAPRARTLDAGSSTTPAQNKRYTPRTNSGRAARPKRAN
jgi:hypothetical protein